MEYLIVMVLFCLSSYLGGSLIDICPAICIDGIWKYYMLQVKLPQLIFLLPFLHFRLFIGGGERDIFITKLNFIIKPDNLQFHI
jgi:hypothetical protein